MAGGITGAKSKQEIIKTYQRKTKEISNCIEHFSYRDTYVTCVEHGDEN